MQQAPPGQDSARPRFPALDPEPPPKAWWRRLLVPAAVVALGAAVWAGVWIWPSAASQSPKVGTPVRQPPVTAGGRILIENGDGGLAIVRPDGTHLTKLPKLGPYAPFPPIRVSPDRRYLVTPDASVVTLTQGRPAVLPSGISVPARIVAPVGLNPFTDHDRYLLLSKNPYGVESSSQIAAYSVTTGKQIPFGSWHTAAGDPGTLGAFVVQPQGITRSSTGNFDNVPDARLEYVAARHKPVLLATAGKLNKMVGLAAAAQVSIFPFPSPSGDNVAVEVMPQAGHQAAGVVVMNRAGTVVASIPASLGAESGLAWSPSGQSLAFVTQSGTGLAVGIWGIAGQSQTVEFPYGKVQYTGCLWAPDGAALLCSDFKGQHWAVVSTATGQMVGEPGRGQPVAWLP